MKIRFLHAGVVGLVLLINACCAAPTFNASALYIEKDVTLPVSPSSSDPLGMANVSGFYGPGAWSGWFLAVIASAIRIHTNPYAKIDPNTWLFVMGTNWAAVDFFLRIPAIWRFDEDSDNAIGSIAASLTLLFWGNLYAILQLVATFAPELRNAAASILDFTPTRNSNRPPTQRILTLVIGLVLPSLAQTLALFSIYKIDNPYNSTFLGTVNVCSIPSMYTMGDPAGFHEPDLFFSLILGLCIFVTVSVALPLIFLSWLYRSHITFRSKVKAFRKSSRCVKVIAISYGTLGVVMILAHSYFSDFWERHFLTRYFLLIWMAPFMLPLILLLTIVLVLMALPLMISIHVGVLIFSGFKTWSGSCFFMPCAPQSILEWDQAYSLLMGIILLFGVEIAPAVKKHREEQKRFEEDMERRMAAARVQRSDERSWTSLDITTQRLIHEMNIEMEMLNGGDDTDDPLPLDMKQKADLFGAFVPDDPAQVSIKVV